MSDPIQNQVKLFGNVDLILNTQAAANPPAIPADGWIYFSIPELGERGIEGRASFNVFWGDVRNQREYFDVALLEALIKERVQVHQNACSLVRIQLNRVELVEIRQMQEALLKDGPTPADVDTVSTASMEEGCESRYIGRGMQHPFRATSQRYELPPHSHLLIRGQAPRVDLDKKYGGLHATYSGIPSFQPNALIKAFEPSGMVIPFESGGMFMPREDGMVLDPSTDHVGGFRFRTDGELVSSGIRDITLHPTGNPGPIPFTDNTTGETFGDTTGIYPADTLQVDPPRGPIKVCVGPMFPPGAIDVAAPIFIGGHTIVRDEISLPETPTSFKGFVGIDMTPVVEAPFAQLDHLLHTLEPLPSIEAANEAQANLIGN